MAFLLSISAKVISMAESPCSTDHLGYLNFFYCVTHIESSKNFVPWENILSRAHYIKLKKQICEFNLKNEFLFTKSTLLIPNMKFFFQGFYSEKNCLFRISTVNLVNKNSFLRLNSQIIFFNFM